MLLSSAGIFFISADHRSTACSFTFDRFEESSLWHMKQDFHDFLALLFKQSLPLAQHRESVVNFSHFDLSTMNGRKQAKMCLRKYAGREDAFTYTWRRHSSAYHSKIYVFLERKKHGFRAYIFLGGADGERERRCDDYLVA